MPENTVLGDTAVDDADDIGTQRRVGIVLSGGPADVLPERERLREVLDPDAVIKVALGAYYDHYRPTAQQIRFGDRYVRVFVWSHRTFVAE